MAEVLGVSLYWLIGQTDTQIDRNHDLLSDDEIDLLNSIKVGDYPVALELMSRLLKRQD